MKLFASTIGAVALATASFAVQAQAAKPDTAKGAALFGQVCVACHAGDGNSVVPANPELATQHPEYLNKQLQEFKPGKRDSAVMKGFGSSLSDDDMRNVAYWRAAQKPQAGTSTDKDLVVLGEKIFRGGIADRQIAACAGCHSPNGAGMPLGTIRNFFVPDTFPAPNIVVPSPPTTYTIHPLRVEHLTEVLKLNTRCFVQGDSYTKHTLNYLLNEPRTVSYRAVAANGEIVGFAFLMVNDDASAHLTTIGIAPEHRRRNLAFKLLDHIEKAAEARGSTTMMVEVRVGNAAACKTCIGVPVMRSFSE